MHGQFKHIIMDLNKVVLGILISFQVNLYVMQLYTGQHIDITFVILEDLNVRMFGEE